jgi:hypothetical protein
MRRTSLSASVVLVSVLFFSICSAGSEEFKRKKEKPLKENKLDANYEGFVIGTDASPKRLTVKGNLVVGNAGYRKFETVDRKNVSYQDLEVGQSGATKDLTVYGETKLGPNRVVGQINNFDPHANQLLISFTNGQRGQAPAKVYLSYVTTLTWDFITGSGISVAAWNDKSIIVDPYLEGRPNIYDFSTTCSLDVFLTMSTSHGMAMERQANNAKIGAVDITKITQDLAMTTSNFSVWTNYTTADTTKTSYQRKGSNALPNGMDLFLTPTVRKPANLSYSMALGIYSPTAGSTNWWVHATAEAANTKAIFQESNGTLFYEVIGQNVLSVSKTVTWNRTITIPSLTGSAFLNWFLGLGDLDQDTALGSMSNAQLLNLFTTLAAQIVSDRTKDGEVKEAILAKILTARDSKTSV